MIWEIDIELITQWYWLFIAVMLGVGMYGTWKHNTAIPLIWSVLVSVVLYYGANALEPLIFGYEYYPIYSIPWILVSIFGIMFFIVQGIFAYNIVKIGMVID